MNKITKKVKFVGKVICDAYKYLFPSREQLVKGVMKEIIKNQIHYEDVGEVKHNTDKIVPNEEIVDNNYSMFDEGITPAYFTDSTKCGSSDHNSCSVCKNKKTKELNSKSGDCSTCKYNEVLPPGEHTESEVE